MPAQKIIVRPENHWKSVTSLTLIRSKSIVPRSRTSMNWNDASTGSGPLWVAHIECAVGEWRSIYVLAFVLEADVLSIYCNKDDVMWHMWLFWQTIIASHVIVCWHSVNYSNIHLIIALTAQSDTQISQGSASTYFRWSGQFRHSFVKGLFRDKWTILPIFIEIGSYLTDKEQKISWHSFLRHVSRKKEATVFLFFFWVVYHKIQIT